MDYQTTDYKMLYHGLYMDVVDLLLDNKRIADGGGYAPDQLLSKWDILRDKYDKVVREEEV